MSVIRGIPSVVDGGVGHGCLLWGVTPMPDESLIGLVARSCADASHRTTAAVLEAAGAPHHQVFDIALGDAVSPGALATAIRQPLHEIERRRYPSVARTPSTAPPVRSFFGTLTAEYDLRPRVRRVSPSALAVSLHHRAIWEHGLLPFCHVTGQWLIDSCPRCGKRLGWYRSPGIELCDDTRCGADLRDSDPGRVDDGDLEAVGAIAGLLDPDPAVHSEAERRFPDQVRTLGRGVAFELGWRLGRLATTERSGQRDVAASLPATEIVHALRDGSRLLRDWPESVVDLLRRTNRDGGATRVLEVAAGLRAIARGREAWPEHRVPIENAVPDMLHRGRQVLRRIDSDLVDGAVATAILGVSSTVLRRLTLGGLVNAAAARGNGHLHACYSRRQVEALRVQLDEGLSVRTASERLGITLHGVEQLVCLGVLRAHDAAIVKATRGDIQISHRDLETMIASIERHASDPVGDRLDRIVPLRRALMLRGGREKAWGAVLIAVATGEISFALSSSGRRLVDRILIEASEVDALLALAFDRRDHAYDFSTTMSRRDAQDVLNLTPGLLMQALRSDLAHCIVDDGRLSVDATLQVARLRVGGGEVLARWGRGRRLPLLLRDVRRFPRLGPTGWSRPEVERALGGGGP